MTAPPAPGPAPGAYEPVTRPLRPDDADAVLDLLSARDIAVLGRADNTAEDVRVELGDPDLDPASCVVEGPLGRLDGMVRLWFDGVDGHVDVDAVARPGATGALLRPLLALTERLAVQGGRARGAAEVTLGQMAYHSDEGMIAALAAAGYAPGTTFNRMRRELDRPVRVLRAPVVAVRRAAEPASEGELRLAHRLHQESFAGHYGFAPRSWDDWHEAWRAREDWGPLWFARVDGEDAGFLQETYQFVPDDDAGYVLRLGVLRRARGRGAARALLLSSFAAMREQGRRAAVLHVDVANASGALALYESVGMRCVLRMDAFRRVVALSG